MNHIDRERSKDISNSIYTEGTLEKFKRLVILINIGATEQRNVEVGILICSELRL